MNTTADDWNTNASDGRWHRGESVVCLRQGTCQRTILGISHRSWLSPLCGIPKLANHKKASGALPHGMGRCKRECRGALLHGSGPPPYRLYTTLGLTPRRERIRSLSVRSSASPHLPHSSAGHTVLVCTLGTSFYMHTDCPRQAFVPPGGQALAAQPLAHAARGGSVNETAGGTCAAPEPDGSQNGPGWHMRLSSRVAWWGRQNVGI